MSTHNSGGPAFPFGQTDSMSGQLVNGWGSEGMTLRDYFAAKALAGMISDCETVERFGVLGKRGLTSPAALAAIAAYELADAMLAERERAK